MTILQTIRNALTLRFVHGTTIAALLISAAQAGCSEEPKFESRRTHRASRPAPRRERPVPSESTAEYTATAISAVANDCAPDAVLMAGEAPAPRNTTLAWPATKPPEQVVVAPSLPNSEPQSIVTATATSERTIVTLAELETARQATLAERSNAVEVRPAAHEKRPRLVPTDDAAALVRQAEEHNRLGLTSASKGAVFTARKEFHAALRAVATALDAAERTDRHSAALGSAMTALTEAEDFAASTSRNDEVDCATLVAGHTTKVVEPTEATRMSSAALARRYAEYAVEQLALAAAGAPTGSVALHRLGKSELGGPSPQPKASRSKAQVFLEASLIVDPNNFPAANDLAVLLAEEGYYDRAVALLRDGLARSPQPALWTNLASIHERRGEAQLAQAARLEARSLAGRGGAGGVLPAHNVAWVDTRTFAAASQPSTEMQTAATAAPRPVAGSAAVPLSPIAPAASPVQSSRRPITTALTPRRNAMVQ